MCITYSSMQELGSQPIRCWCSFRVLLWSSVVYFNN